jgi:hypothetical protein
VADYISANSCSLSPAPKKAELNVGSPSCVLD